MAGKTLGRFRLDDPKPMLFGPDIGLATLTEGNDWSAAALDDAGQQGDGQVCLAIGYPGTLGSGRPPLLRAGRIIPGPGLAVVGIDDHRCRGRLRRTIV